MFGHLPQIVWQSLYLGTQKIGWHCAYFSGFFASTSSTSSFTISGRQTSSAYRTSSAFAIPTWIDIVERRVFYEIVNNKNPAGGKGGRGEGGRGGEGGNVMEWYFEIRV